MKVSKHNVSAVACFTIAESRPEANTAGLPRGKEQVAYRMGSETSRYTNVVISLGLVPRRAVPRRGLSLQVLRCDVEKAVALSRWDFAAALRTFVLCKMCNEVKASLYRFVAAAIVLQLQH